MTAAKVGEPRSHSDEMSFGAWIAFIVPAGLVWAVTPAAWLTVIYHYLIAQSHPKHWFYWFWVGHSVCDVPFSLFLFYLSRKAQERRPLPLAPPERMKEIFMECLQVGIAEQERKMGIRRPRSQKANLTKDEVDPARAIAAREKYCQWFVGKPAIEDIKHGNIYEWCAWAIANKKPSELQKGSPEDRVIEQGIAWLENRVHYKFEPGFNPALTSIRLTLDPVKTRHRPFGYYVVTNGVTLGVYAFLYAQGFKFERYGACSYITRDARPSRRGTVSGSGTPTLFIHGLGIGLGQYMAFLRRLSKQPQPIMILIQPNISTQIYDSRFLYPPGKDEHVESFKMICAAKGYKEVTVLSHSNGTFVHGWLLRGAKDLCARNILTDPVGFRLWEADVAHSFVHKKWTKALEVLLGYFVARELGTAHTIARLFVWTDMMLWEHELPSTDPSRLQIVLGSKDFLVDTANVVQYLHDQGIHDDCILNVPGAPHGAVLIVNKAGMKRVLANL